ncbi:related to ketoreductases [Cephalotrichum gorgonifer]|uniref:Related to ketoreductases n=1 Tax=Cephalotrichum gorgonifer TaxID=2041049 RepID=A0AAE8N6Z4_9PEZI|nr:related to ketoreductases [Cephalotrichum gorgonifer]
MAPLVWLVTGSTSGLGKTLVSHIVSKGDKVVATGRNAEQRLASLVSENVAVVDLDVSDSREVVDVQMKKAWEAFGQIDIVVNNAGSSSPKTVEEGSDQFMQNLFDVNVFGPIRVTQAILPYFRSAERGSLVFIGGGVSWAPIPFLSFYSAAKSALNRFVEGLDKELAGQGIHCTIFEPGGFASQLGAPRPGSDEGFGKYQPKIKGYEGLFAETMEVFANEIAPNVPGDIEKIAGTMVSLVVGQADGSKRLPVRVVLGSDSMVLIRQKCKEQLEIIDELEDLARSTDQDGSEGVNHGGMLRLTSMLR